MNRQYPVIPQGKRAVVVGRTGSGKTVWCRWILKRSPLRWIIIDQKHDEGFDVEKGFGVVIENRLPDCDELLNLWKENKFVIVRPSMLAPLMMDSYILYLHENLTHFGLYVDELYYVHENGRAGPGLVGILTRGRSRKQSFLGGVQRPAWISRFVFSESDYFALFTLTLKDDRKRMSEFIGESAMENPPKLIWTWFDISENKLLRYGAVPFKG